MLNTVNVILIDTYNHNFIERLASFRETEEGNKAAEKLFVEWVNDLGTACSDDDLDNGYFEYEGKGNSTRSFDGVIMRINQRVHVDTDWSDDAGSVRVVSDGTIVGFHGNKALVNCDYVDGYPNFTIDVPLRDISENEYTRL